MLVNCFLNQFRHFFVVPETRLFSLLLLLILLVFFEGGSGVSMTCFRSLSVSIHFAAACYKSSTSVEVNPKELL